MSFCLEGETEFCSETDVKCLNYVLINHNNSVSLPIKLFAQLPPLEDHPKTVHHKVFCNFLIFMYFRFCC